MTEQVTQISRKWHSLRGAGCLRFILMAFVFIWNYGFPEPTGIVSALSGFATPAFFILSGFFILPDNRERRLKKLGRKIKRMLLWFTCLFVVFLLINIAVCLIGKISVKISLRTVFNFVVLNLWFLPMGNNIWFAQAMLYAYILIFAADKLNLLKFYKPVMIVTGIIMLLTGEFAGVIGFHVLGYDFIAGNWLTRALPYILLGMLIREKSQNILKLKKRWFIIMIVIGSVLTIGELLLLGKMGLLVYQGHMTGYGVMAFGACCLALKKTTLPETVVWRIISFHDSALSGLIYSFMEPVYYAAALTIGSVFGGFAYLGGLIAFVICVIFALIFKKIRLTEALFTSSRTRSDCKE